MACYNPYKLKDKHPHTGEDVFVPCGKCVDCRKRLISGWSFRLMQEEKQSDSAYFVTLTYDTQHVPITRNNFMTLDKVDVQHFMKRLRYHSPKTEKPIKYFAVGEYGSKGMRPHYHLILFNAQPEFIVKAWSRAVRDDAGKLVLDENDEVRRISLGNVFFGHDCHEAAAGYCLKYMYKDAKIPMHRNDDRIPEFRLMSKDLGSITSPSKC